MKQTLYFLPFIVILLACSFSRLSVADPTPSPTPTVVVAQFSTPEPTFTPTPSPNLAYLLTPSPTVTPTPTEPSAPESTPVQPVEPTLEPTFTPEPLPTATPVPPIPTPPTDTPAPESTPTSAVDFVLRLVRMRTNEENSWDGKLGDFCGSDHSIYVYVADAQENLLDGVLVGDKYGNFEVPTGIDGPGMVRILVWSATMEVAVMGHQDGTRYAGDFSPLLSTVDEDIPLDWLQQGGYCQSPEDCQQRVDSNQLCRGHYSYDVIFQRTW